VQQRILVSEGDGEEKKKDPIPPLPPAPDTAWSFLGLTGAVFFLIGSADQLLAFVPATFGNQEWEFGTISSYLDAMPLPALGATLFMAAGMALGRRWMVKTGSVVLVLMSALIVALLVLYVTIVPVALKAVNDPAIRFGLKKAIVKGLGQSLGYPVVFLALAVKAWRHSREPQVPQDTPTS
jgi:hypothetical protein